MSTIIPRSITAGLTFDLTFSLPGYPAPAWSVTLVLRGKESIDLESTADGQKHQLAATAAETGQWTAGTYRYALRVTDGTDVHEVESGRIEIEPDLADQENPETGDHARRVLAAVEAVIEGRASLDQERYRINNRELYRTPMNDLLKLRQHYRNEIARQRRGERGSSLLGRRVVVRFT